MLLGAGGLNPFHSLLPGCSSSGMTGCAIASANVGDPGQAGSALLGGARPVYLYGAYGRDRSLLLPPPALRLPATNSPHASTWPQHTRRLVTPHTAAASRTLICAQPSLRGSGEVPFLVSQRAACASSQLIGTGLSRALLHFIRLITLAPPHTMPLVGPPSSAQPSLRGSGKVSLTLVLTLAPISTA